MEQASVKRPGIVTLVVSAWKSALGAVLGMLPLFAVVTAGLFGLNYAFPLLEQALKVIHPSNDSLFVLMVVPGAWVFGLEQLALGLVVAPAVLVTMRHVLIHDGWRLSPGPMLRFWGWVAAELVLVLGLLYLAGLAATPNLQLISYVLKGAAILIPPLMLLVFPAVAEGEPTPGIIARLDKGLERWDGTIWRVVLLVLFTGGPAWLLMKVPAAIIIRGGGDADAVQKFDATLVGSVVHSALTVLLVVTVSAGVAWAYQFSKLPRPAKLPLGTVVHPMTRIPD
jgi:hypothetical protein